MTYCVGLLVDTGVVMLSDSRTNAAVDQILTRQAHHPNW
jgi:putative proteasome-type protease